jgi:hypothetical protein
LKPKYGRYGTVDVDGSDGIDEFPEDSIGPDLILDVKDDS